MNVGHAKAEPQRDKAGCGKDARPGHDRDDPWFFATGGIQDRAGGEPPGENHEYDRRAVVKHEAYQTGWSRLVAGISLDTEGSM